RWIEAVESLMASIQEWAEEQKWLVSRETKTIRGDYCGEYQLPQLFIRTPQIKMVIDPIGLDIVGADGRVDIEAFPSFHRFILIRKGENWRLLADSMAEWPEGWGKESFLA